MPEAKLLQKTLVYRVRDTFENAEKQAKAMAKAMRENSKENWRVGAMDGYDDFVQFELIVEYDVPMVKDK